MVTRLLHVVLPLLFAILALICPVRCAAQTGPAIIVSISAPKYDAAKNVYTGEFTVNDVRPIRRLVYVVEDSETGTEAIGKTEVNLSGSPTKRYLLEGARFKAERKYVLKVQAVGWDEEFIPRSGDNYDRDSAEQFILASWEFTHQPATPLQFAFKINSANVDREIGELILRLTLPSGFTVEKYDGFIVDGNGQQVGMIPLDLYVPVADGPRVTVPLPEAIAKATEERQYKVALRLVTEDNQVDEQTFEFTVPGVTPPGLGPRIIEALSRNPVIALAIVFVIAAVATVLILLGRKRQNSLPPVYHPQNESTLGGRVAMRRNRLRVRVVQSPGKSRGTEKIVKDFPFTIGRDETCQMRIDDSHVSRKHLEICVRDGCFFVTDLNSTHGTFMNQVRLRSNAATPIPAAVSVELGDRTVIDLDTGE